LGKVWTDIFLGGQGQESGLEGNGGEEVEADEGSKGEGNGDGDEIDVDGQPARGVWLSGMLILRDCHFLKPPAFVSEKEKPTYRGLR